MGSLIEELEQRESTARARVYFFACVTHPSAIITYP